MTVSAQGGLLRYPGNFDLDSPLEREFDSIVIFFLFYANTIFTIFFTSEILEEL